MGVAWCSVVVLCCGAFATMAAIALVAIGATTDHWTLTTVNRTSVLENGGENMTDYMFFTRHRGLFRTCFPESDRPPEDTEGLYLSIMEDWCFTRNYHLSELMNGEIRPSNLSDPANTQLQLMRSTPILMFAYLFSMCVVGILGLCGCWQQSANKLITTASFQLLCALLGACAMATWHAAYIYESKKVHDPGFPMSWPDWLQESNSDVETSWSYFITWTGIVLTLLASLLTSGSAICLRSHRRKWEDNSLRMKLRMSRMFAQHAYFPDTPDLQYSPRDYPTMQANYPTKNFIEAYETRRESPQNSSRQPFLGPGSGGNGGMMAGGPACPRPGMLVGHRVASMPPPNHLHSREPSDLSHDSYRSEEYRKVMSELQDSKF
eukprot:TRINITY_DN30603_c0_g2_i2.p1 TRINITY_DN30603_c0_g2~~TRINITY_DN30603_c0_g2_i2.p1  ORF type:complete len:378 (+),score=49.93 TRINITY_DN30603_c0_g2_i2:45-1178(+)